MFIEVEGCMFGLLSLAIIVFVFGVLSGFAF